MLTHNIENKVKLALIASIGSFVTAVIICLITFDFTGKLIRESRKKIYVLDGSIPVLIRQTEMEENRLAEYRSHINLYHALFFNLPPDDVFIKENLSRAMYLVDESGLKEYNNLKEKNVWT